MLVSVSPDMKCPLSKVINIDISSPYSLYMVRQWLDISIGVNQALAIFVKMKAQMG